MNAMRSKVPDNLSHLIKYVCVDASSEPSVQNKLFTQAHSDLMNFIQNSNIECGVHDIENDNSFQINDDYYRSIVDFNHLFNKTQKAFKSHLKNDNNCSYKNQKLFNSKSTYVKLIT